VISVRKNQIYHKEEAHASKLDVGMLNENFGFHCLHYSVSEASGHLKIKILNKKRQKCKVGVRTKEIQDGAKEVSDFIPLCEEI